MQSSIERELRERCRSNPNLGILLAQWEYDVRLLANALQVVGNNFPHYSFHDATHSETILQRIASLLGPAALAQLSATDLWLLLEASYLHDAGMIVLHTCKREDLSSPAFAAHLKQLQASSDSDLAAAARRIQELRERRTPLEILEGHLDLLVIYAEFVRARHPERAYEAAIDPVGRTAAASPRTELLPRRFWHIVGNICRGHGESRDWVMKLPYRESGVAGDHCHPRFVAFMLRLGDLLDLDSGRFCPTMNATVPRLPRTSAAHRQKHDGIRHLVIDEKRLEVVGEYGDVDAYLEAERWFSWLREELTEQLLRWDDITPARTIGPLPSIGQIEARLRNQLIFDRTSRPRFEVDRDKLLDLMRGANIYSGPQDAVREIVQNAIDATLLRYSFDSQSLGEPPAESPDKLRTAMLAHPISVTLEPSANTASSSELTCWRFTVSDNGIGMRLDDIRHLLKLGSSSRNPYKGALREWLPAWARPSGTFGIGFHSLFDYCRMVHIRTRHPTSDRGYQLTFEVRDERSDPSVVVSELHNDSLFPMRSGTEVEAILELDLSMSMDALERRVRSDRLQLDLEEARQVATDYDFVTPGDLPLLPAVMRDTVRSLAKESLCKILLNNESARMSSDGDRPANTGQRLFHADTGLELTFESANWGYNARRLRYRGAPAELLRYNASLLQFECNIHALEARDILELSRNNLTPRGHLLVAGESQRALRALVPQWLNALRASKQSDQRVLALVSLYALLHEHPEAGDEWRRAIYISESANGLETRTAPTTDASGGESGFELGILADTDAVEVSYFDSMHGFFSGKPPVTYLVKGKRTLGRHEDTYTWATKFFRRFFPNVFLDFKDGNLLEYKFKKASAEFEDMSDAALRYLLTRRVKHFIDTPVGCRSMIPCPNRYALLAIDPSKVARDIPFYDPFLRRFMANPFVAKPDGVRVPNIESYVQWVSTNCGSRKADVAVAVKSFIHDTDKLVGSAWPEPKRYDLAQVDYELGRIA